jgi:PleD family two-component response regulator
LVVAQLPFAFEALQSDVTISLGTAHSRYRGHDLNALVAAADAAMYEAKRAGRNCTRTAAAASTTASSTAPLAARQRSDTQPA